MFSTSMYLNGSKAVFSKIKTSLMSDWCSQARSRATFLAAYWSSNPPYLLCLAKMRATFSWNDRSMYLALDLTSSLIMKL